MARAPTFSDGSSCHSASQLCPASTLRQTPPPAAPAQSRSAAVGWQITQAIDAIGGYVQGVASLSTGEKNSLLAKLRAAANAADRGSLGAACNQLDAFLNEVDAKTKTGQLSSSDQTILTGATRATQRSLGCFGPLFAFLGGF